MGDISTIDLTIPAGPVINNDGKPFPHSMDPQLRKLGLSTRMVAGVPSLAPEHVVFRKGDQLTSEQVRRPALVYLSILFLNVTSFLGSIIKAKRRPNGHFQGLHCGVCGTRSPEKSQRDNLRWRILGLVFRKEVTRKCDDAGSRRPKVLTALHVCVTVSYN